MGRPVDAKYLREAGGLPDKDISLSEACLIQIYGLTCSARCWADSLADTTNTTGGNGGKTDHRLLELANTLASVQRQVQRLGEARGVNRQALDMAKRWGISAQRDGMAEL